MSTQSGANRDLTKPIWVSPKEASRLVAIGRTRIYELIADGALDSIKFGRKRLISYASLERLGASERGGPNG
jgi:excisionase family DNA binding protein